MWADAYHRGLVSIGSQKFKYIKKSDTNFWTSTELCCKHKESELISTEVLWAASSSLKISKDGNTLFILSVTSDGASYGYNLIRKTSTKSSLINLSRLNENNRSKFYGNTILEDRDFGVYAW
ncbi:MAG: hypothetical protein HXX14_17610 [Bacteroidetes bacterium]|nr:hypothetical protein [Bacteroidota bacterium]